MHSQIPEPLRALVEQLARLPGLGPKSAMRVAMTLLKWPEAETRRLGKGIHDLRDNLHLCSRCGGLSATNPCDICKDENRSRDTLCLVHPILYGSVPHVPHTDVYTCLPVHRILHRNKECFPYMYHSFQNYSLSLYQTSPGCIKS